MKMKTKMKTFNSVSSYASPLIDLQLISSEILCYSTKYNDLGIGNTYVNDYSSDVHFE